MIKQTKKFYNDAFIEIFSNVRFVKSLLQDFVHESWVSLVDFSHMEVTKSQFTGISEDKREADLLLKFTVDTNLHSLCSQRSCWIMPVIQFPVLATELPDPAD